MPSPDQLLTAARMRSAEQALIDAGTSVDELMQRAGRGAAEWVWRIAAGRSVTVLCGPGNNGGDGYVIAQALSERGGAVTVIAAVEPQTDAARTARNLFKGEVLESSSTPHALRQAQGDRVLVDCLFGTGLTRPLSDDLFDLLLRLAASHRQRIAVDLPSGVHSDSGAVLNQGLPHYDLTIALGAWKPAHFLMPAAAVMGAVRLVPIGVMAAPDAAQLMQQPELTAPAANAHKYTRGLLGVIGGAMPGAALLAARAAQHAGAGYVKLLGQGEAVPADLVHDARPLGESLGDKRIGALLVGPGLGRDQAARERLNAVLAAQRPTVLDADALAMLDGWACVEHREPRILTPHSGEFEMLEKVFKLPGEGSKIDRAIELAANTGSIIVAKGPDTIVARGDGRVAIAARSSSWLSTAGTGDVLAGTIASRLASGADPFVAACEGVWLHSEAARLAGPAFTASELAESIKAAYAATL